MAAKLELRPVKAFFRYSGDLESIGTSGTIRSAERVATSLGIIDSHCLTPGAVEELIKRVLAFDTIGDLSLRGLSQLLSAEGGRAYLASVPGVAQAPLGDARLAALLNWVIRAFSGTQLAISGRSNDKGAEVSSYGQRSGCV